MKKYTNEIAKKLGVKIIEISLRAVNAENHTMFYQAGVENFYGLSKMQNL